MMPLSLKSCPIGVVGNFRIKEGFTSITGAVLIPQRVSKTSSA
jgi:hypothetical protein